MKITTITSFGLGLLFALGLGIAGMVQPEKVVGFLDVAGSWDPALLLVLGAAVPTYFVVFRLTMRREKPLFDAQFRVPSRRDITGRLVAGSLIFGIGWGLGGYCPGPALASLTTGAPAALTFLGAMAVGMGLYQLRENALSRRKARAEAAVQSVQPALSQAS